MGGVTRALRVFRARVFRGEIGGGGLDTADIHLWMVAIN